MRFIRTILVLSGLAGLLLATGGSLGAEKVQPETSTAQAAPAHEAHGLSQSAVEIASPFGFPITNSMVVTWIVALGLIVFAQIATRNMKQIPGGAQNFWEWMVESLH